MLRPLSIRASLILYLFYFLQAPIPQSLAVVGDAPPASSFGRSVVMIVGANRTMCSAVAIGRDLLLSAAQCLRPGITYKYIVKGPTDRPLVQDIARGERHPNFDLQKLLNRIATPDLALIKTRYALPAQIPSVPLSTASVAVGDTLFIVGFGLTVAGDPNTGGTAHLAKLVVTDHPDRLQIHLIDPKNEGLGACSGDAGAPAFRSDGGNLTVVGVVSWSTGPGSAGCGELTGLVPLQPYRAWILDTARALGSPLEQ